MRCSCRYCESEAYMIQAESDKMGCVCPVCGARCTDCLGTDTVIPREAFRAMKAQSLREAEAEKKHPAP